MEKHINKNVAAKITNIKDYGLFVEFVLDGKKCTGLLHISEIKNKYIKDIYSEFELNSKVNLRIIKYNKDRDRYGLAMKNPKVAVKNNIQASATAFADLQAYVEKKLESVKIEKIRNKKVIKKWLN